MIMNNNYNLTPTPELNEALAKTQLEIVQPRLDKEGHFGKYLSLSGIDRAVREAIKKADAKLSYQQELVIDTDASGRRQMHINTYIRHSSGEVIVVGGVQVEIGKTAQQTLANVTYAKRGSLSAAFGVVADEEDDGQQISELQRRDHDEEQQRLAIVARMKTELEKAPKDQRAMILAVGSQKPNVSNGQLDSLNANRASLIMGAAMFAQQIKEAD